MTLPVTRVAATMAQTAPDRAAEVATQEFSALLTLLHELGPTDWQRPTDCAGWTVWDIVAHVTGACEESKRLRVFLRHNRTAGRRYRGKPWLDAINQVQIDDRAGHTPDQLLAELATLGPAAVRARRRMPGLLRRRTPPAKATLPPGATLAFLVDVIYIRDIWMHRVDIARATGRSLAPTISASEVVAQVVRDLDSAWSGPAFTLELTGHGAGSWHVGTGAPVADVTADAVEACRLLSGRPLSSDVFVTRQVQLAEQLAATRVVF